MAGYQNLHSHTNFCDGALPPEEMIRAAIEKGCDSIGFSDHSYVPFDANFAMSPDTSKEYVKSINELKHEFKGIIEVFLGIEHDYYTAAAVDGLDYCIGASHYIKKGNEYIITDNGLKRHIQVVEQYFGGDYYAIAEEYFATIAGITKIRKVDIIGHFDLVEKNNNNGSLFDETHPRYKAAAITAMEEILKDCRLFEVNTGAMHRVGKLEPYPSVFLLKELYNRGGEVILSSDSHNAESMCFKFAEMKELLKTIGFKYIKRLTKNGFIDERL